MGSLGAMARGSADRYFQQEISNELKLVPEGVIWLLVNGVLSALLLAVVAAAGFVWLYGEAGGVVWREAPWHFVLLSAKAGIVWGPVMVLSLSALPKRWKRAVW